MGWSVGVCVGGASSFIYMILLEGNPAELASRFDCAFRLAKRISNFMLF